MSIGKTKYPQAISVIFMDKRSAQGSYVHSPQAFYHMFTADCHVLYGGIRYPVDGLRCNFTNPDQNCLEAYSAFLRHCSQKSRSNNPTFSPDIAYQSWIRWLPMFCFRGSHWLALIRVDGRYTYVDSLGEPFERYLPAAARVVFSGYNTRVDALKRPIQSLDSATCGLYCLFFAFHLISRRLPLKSILFDVNFYARSVCDNDSFITEWYRVHCLDEQQ
uniref:Ubiquitin-like protease family profile domain-containing protein n=1 Tax=Plectus sambesii TaxID=2011161 RepID=A0A914XL03_9BILA